MEIKLAQETYFSTYDRYVSTGTDDTDFLPADASDKDTTSIYPWNLVCPGANDNEEAWCSLGLRPQFNGCPSDIPSATGQCSYHQFVTIGWQPGAAAPPDTRITNPSRRWWYAIASGDLDGNGIPSEWFLSSEVSEAYNIESEEL